MLYIFDTHPIQYRAPVFIALSQHMKVKVFFFHQQFDGKKWWLHERDKIPKQTWGISLTEGYDNETWNNPHLFSFYRKAKLTLEKNKPSAILIYGYFLPENWILLKIARALEIPCLFIGETFGRQSTSIRQKIKNSLLPYFFNRISKIISIGTHSSEFYKQYGVPSQKITEAKYAVDISFFKKTGSDKKIAKSKVNLDPSLFTILFVARLFHRKRPLDVVETHKALQQKFPNLFQTVIVGNGELEADLQAASQGLKHFHFVGFKNQKEVISYYEAAEVLFVPSEYETWGLVVNEAMAVGTPALVTENCGVAHDLVVHDQSGWVIAVGKIDHAVEIFGSLIQNPNKLHLISENAQKKVTSEYTIENFAQKIAQAFEEVTKKKSPNYYRDPLANEKSASRE